MWPTRLGGVCPRLQRGGGHENHGRPDKHALLFLVPGFNLYFFFRTILNLHTFGKTSSMNMPLPVCSRLLHPEFGTERRGRLQGPCMASPERTNDHRPEMRGRMIPFIPAVPKKRAAIEAALFLGPMPVNEPWRWPHRWPLEGLQHFCHLPWRRTLDRRRHRQCGRRVLGPNSPHAGRVAPLHRR